MYFFNLGVKGLINCRRKCETVIASAGIRTVRHLGTDGVTADFIGFHRPGSKRASDY